MDQVPKLAYALNPAFALLEAGRIPGHVDVHLAAEPLQVAAVFQPACTDDPIRLGRIVFMKPARGRVRTWSSQNSKALV